MTQQEIIETLKKDKWMDANEIAKKLGKRADAGLRRLRLNGEVFCKEIKEGRIKKYIYKKK
ncbi:MAG: hypothetical protein ACOC44_09995 [Promethearchaeia archaeon]